jgi:mRNA interferase RelE/StbE
MGQGRWHVIIHRKAERVLKRLDADMLERMRRAMRGLASQPRPAGCKKRIGYESLYRIGVGDWWIIYAMEEDQLIVLVLEVSPRGGAYRNI